MPPPGFDELSPDEKLDYINALWQRFTAQPEDVPAPEWHRDVIAERLAVVDRGEGSARPWDAVRKDLLAKLRDTSG
jgi:putative addiction module component (TIGR02574 family)